MTLAKVFVISGWRIEPPLNRMTRAGRVLQLEPRVMQVLCKLAEQPGEVFTRNELMDSVWQGVTVGEEALTRAISELRKAFKDDPKKPAIIETIYKTGYRLLVPIETDAPVAEEKTDNRSRHHFRLFGYAAVIAASAIAFVIVVLLPKKSAVQIRADTYADFRLSPLTSLPGEELSPSLSPDGTEVVFSWREPGKIYSSLVLKPIDSGEVSILFTGIQASYESPAWSPDGEHIAFVRKNDNACEILLYGIQSRSLDSLVSCNISSFPHLAWRPDGNAIIYSDRERDAAPYHLFELSLIDDSIMELTKPPLHIIGDRQAAYSSDGASIAFLRVTATGISNIYLKPLYVEQEKRITFDDAKIGGLSWLKSGDDIVFTSNRRGAWDLWKISPDSGDTSILSMGAEAFGFSYSPNVQQIVFEKRSVDTNLWRIDLENPSAPATGFASSTRWEDDPSYSNSGEWLAFVSDRSGTPNVWVAESMTGDVRRLTSFDGGLIFHPRWSPDDKSIVFNARVNGNADIYTLNVETGGVTKITDHPGIDTTPEWSKDGNHILYSSNRSGDWQIWKATLNGGNALQLTTEGGIDPLESPVFDGILHTRSGSDRLWLLGNAPINTSSPLEAYSPEIVSNWTAHGGYVFFLAVEEEQIILWRYDPVTQSKMQLHIMDNINKDHLAHTKFTIAPDGKTVIYSNIDARHSDLQLLELDSRSPSSTQVAKGKAKSFLQ